jgi:hypothetical protein
MPTRVLRLAYLSPDIVQDIINGEQPQHLTARKLANAPKPPLDWAEQRRVLGFA